MFGVWTTNPVRASNGLITKPLASRACRTTRSASKERVTRNTHGCYANGTIDFATRAVSAASDQDSRGRTTKKIMLARSQPLGRSGWARHRRPTSLQFRSLSLISALTSLSSAAVASDLKSPSFRRWDNFSSNLYGKVIRFITVIDGVGTVRLHLGLAQGRTSEIHSRERYRSLVQRWEGQ